MGKRAQAPWRIGAGLLVCLLMLSTEGREVLTDPGEGEGPFIEKHMRWCDSTHGKNSEKTTHGYHRCVGKTKFEPAARPSEADAADEPTGRFPLGRERAADRVQTETWMERGRWAARWTRS